MKTGSTDKPAALKAWFGLLFSENQSSVGDSIKTSIVGDLGAVLRSKSSLGLKIVGSFVDAGDDLSAYACKLGDIVVLADFSVRMSKTESTLSFIGGLGCRVMDVSVDGSGTSSGMDLTDEAFTEGASRLDFSRFISSPSSSKSLAKERQSKSKGAVT